MIRGKTYDLKVGYTCNNNCLHCVIETNALDLKRNNIKLDSSFAQIMEEIESQDFQDSEKIVLTGGEITIRRDFMRIVNAILKKQPQKQINIQTNARNLKPFIKELSELSKNISYTIAVHSSNEELHNKIVGNRFDKKSPYIETMEAINEIIEVYGEFDKVARIEMVLSKNNYFDLHQSIKDLYMLGAKHIGVSYPHLDGFLMDFGVEKVREIGMSYKEVKKYLYDVYLFANEHPDLQLSFEEIPVCMWRDNENNLLPHLRNIKRMGSSGDSISVKFPGQEANHDFATIWVQMHRHTDKCKECAYANSCLGVWHEAVEAWGSEGFIPLTKEENDKGGQSYCSY